MDVRIHQSWEKVLKPEFEKEYFKELTTFVRGAYTTNTIYPPPRYIFHAFDLCPFDEVKVVILGQDPYHGRGQAHGLCFSVNDGVPLPPSLQNIYKEIHNDLGVSVAKTGNLERWARQGVLLLNATLTVQAGQAGSHQNKGWERFTDAVISLLSEKKEHLVFLLWGRYAQNKEILINPTKHLILKAAHPSPFSAASGFFGCKHFSKTNEYLLSTGIVPINWAQLCPMDFFEEYRKLKLLIPRCALFNIASQNSDYCAYSRYNKNCYLLRGGDYNEDCLYGYWVYHNRDCTDCAYVYDSELLYECIDCRKSYNCNFCQDCQTCTDCSFLYNCHGCQDCYGCVNLKQAQYHIFNKKYSREEYFKKLKELQAMPPSEQQRKFEEFAQKHPRVYMRQLNNENCAGDHVYNSKNCYACYDVQDAQDCMYLTHALKMKDCVDGDFMYGAEMCYESISIEGFNCNFCYVVWESSDMEFCELCFGCKNCFGCIGLQHKEYYILNKPYTPEEYSKKVTEIKAQLRAEKKYNTSLPTVFWEG